MEIWPTQYDECIYNNYSSYTDILRHAGSILKWWACADQRNDFWDTIVVLGFNCGMGRVPVLAKTELLKIQKFAEAFTWLFQN